MQAKSVLDFYWDGVLPVDMNKILKSMYISYTIEDIEFIDVKREAGIWSFFISKNLTKQSQRLALAYGLAFVSVASTLPNDYFYSVKAIEFQEHNNHSFGIYASKYALEVLAPKDIALYLIQRKKHTQVELLADSFFLGHNVMRRALLHHKIL